MAEHTPPCGCESVLFHKPDCRLVAIAAPRVLTYLACPYSHHDRAVRVARFEAANRAAAALMQAGHRVFSPISHTHPIAEAGDLPLGWDYWEAFDRAYLSISARVVVLRIDGWDQSKGVAAELRIAAEAGLPVEYFDPPEISDG